MAGRQDKPRRPQMFRFAYAEGRSRQRKTPTNQALPKISAVWSRMSEFQETTERLADTHDCNIEARGPFACRTHQDVPAPRRRSDGSGVLPYGQCSRPF